MYIYVCMSRPRYNLSQTPFKAVISTAERLAEGWPPILRP